MKEIWMTVTSKGQVTIPAEVRRHLRIKKHQRIALVIEKNGDVKWKVPRYPDIDSIVGKAGKARKPLNREAALEIARTEAVKSKVAHAKK